MAQRKTSSGAPRTNDAPAAPCTVRTSQVPLPVYTIVPRSSAPVAMWYSSCCPSSTASSCTFRPHSDVIKGLSATITAGADRDMESTHAGTAQQQASIMGSARRLRIDARAPRSGAGPRRRGKHLPRLWWAPPEQHPVIAARPDRTWPHR
eukprot:scaffold7079_cov128-Isochrysis_galbana.AAC.2